MKGLDAGKLFLMCRSITAKFQGYSHTQSQDIKGLESVLLQVEMGKKSQGRLELKNQK